jgi:hypothetical protein
MLGRVVDVVVGDPHASLVWMSVFAGAAIVSLGYLLGAALFGRGCGWAAAAILATSPVCWFHSEIALTPIVDAALVAAMALTCWRAIGRGGGWAWVVAMAVTLGAIAGVRQQTAPALFPLCLYTFSRFPRPWGWKLVVGVLVFGLVCALWFFPMVNLSGGLNAYWQVMGTRMHLDAHTTAWGGGMRVLADSVCFTIAGWWAGLLLAGLIAATELALFAFGRTKEDGRPFFVQYRDRLLFLTLWSAPLVAFYLVFYMTMPGYVLGYFPVIAVLAGLALHKSACRIARTCDPARQTLQRQPARRGWILTLGPVVLLNCVIFLFRPPIFGGLLLGMKLTALDIRAHDQQLSAWFAAIRTRYRPEEVLICHYGQSFSWGFRHFQYHLFEYDNCLLTPDPALVAPFDKKLWLARNRRVEFSDHFDPRGKQVLVLIVPPETDVGLFAGAFDVSHAKRWDVGGGAPLYTLDVQSLPGLRQTLTSGDFGIDSAIGRGPQRMKSGG